MAQKSWVKFQFHKLIQVFRVHSGIKHLHIDSVFSKNNRSFLRVDERSSDFYIGRDDFF